MSLSIIKMKYKLLLIIFLPCLIILGFLSKYLIEDYASIRQMQMNLKMTSVIDEAGAFIRAIQNEETISSLSFIDKNLIPPKELAAARQLTDNSIAAFQDAVGKVNLSVNGKLFVDSFQKLFEKIEQIKQKRRFLDTQSISLDEFKNFSHDVVLDTMEQVNDIARNNLTNSLARRIYCYLLLLSKSGAEENERFLIAQALNQEQITPQAFAALLNTIGQIQAFEDSYFLLANNEEDSWYKNTVSSFSDKEALRIRDEVINRASNGKWNINPHQWLDAKMGQILLLSNVEKKLLNQNDADANAQINEATRELILITTIIVATLLITFLLTLLTLRSLTKNLQEGVEALTAAGQEILTSITQTSSGTAETAAAVSETTTTVEELKQTAQLSADKAKTVSEISNDTLTILKSGENALENSIEGMNRIQDGMGTISDSIIRLSEQSQTIGRIIDTVNELAEQSHLLAVNAAIEAAKAGDQGKGFAVVAGEVRSLAEQSKQATFQVRSILSDIQNATSAAVMATEQGSKAVANGMNQSLQTNESIRSASVQMSNVVHSASQIAISSQQQLIGVGQVTVAMTNIKEASNQHVENLRQIESGVQALNMVGRSLQTLVMEYKI